MAQTILSDILARLGEPEALAILRPHWEESLAALGEGVPGFLDPAVIRESRDWAGLAPETEEPLTAMARRLAADPDLRLLAGHCERLLFEHMDYPDCRQWPSLQQALGDQNGIFYLLAAMSMVTRVRALHRQMDVPEAVTRDTCRQISCFSHNYQRGHNGRLGICLTQLYWLRLYVQGRLFRVGRFEYKIEPFHGRVEVYRNRQTGAKLALSAAGVGFNAEGYVARGEENTVWTTELNIGTDAVTGTPISPRGMALRRETRLPLDVWERVLAKGNPVLDMHIPEGGGMTPEKCADSFRRAPEFFRRFFPDQACNAISCAGSWIFNTQLAEILPAGANLNRFQRELYLLPIPSSNTEGLWFIFLQDQFDPQSAPRETSLQRAILDYLNAGNTWRAGAMLFFLEDLPRFGTEHYRRQEPEVLPLS